ncbi:MAG: acyl-CoA dehydrogenase [Comamonadaceae bacterium]|nr:acyl-CoA dehydrogenase [Comamonadaceae bacterium]
MGSLVARESLPDSEQRTMLRDSLRGFLTKNWPVSGAVERGRDPIAVASLWTGLVEQGLGSLGSDPEEGGLREIVVAMEELGRAAAPAPLLGAVFANFGMTATKNATAEAFLNRIQSGEVRAVVSFGELDPSLDASADLILQDGKISGVLRFIDGGCAATHLLVAVSGGVAIVDLVGVGVEVVQTRALGTDAWCQITLTDAPANVIAVAQARLFDLRLVVSVAVLARAHGAARRAFELAVDYSKERRQFGRAIGSFQAIQHKLANGWIALEGVRLTIEHAAEEFDFRGDEWCYFAHSAISFGAPALRQTALEVQHVLGAIGYAEEHEAPRHFRRVHLDALVLGGALEARKKLAALLLDTEKTEIPRYNLGEAGNKFRKEVESWLTENWSGIRKKIYDAKDFHDREFDSSFALDLGKTGWLALAWPKEFGGEARAPLEQLAFIEAMENAEAPRAGASVQANALIMFGTQAQQERYLPEIRRGEVMHGMGYSEPDSGSDLASLRTSAELDGDHWVINGQKIWTTTYWGKYMFLAARTDHNASPPQAGISMFIVPMDTPGISVKPAKTMYDGRFANIFYDNVRIPAENIVGPINGGWKVLTGALSNERGTIGGGIVLKVAHGFNLLCGEIRSSPVLRSDPLVRERIAKIASEIEVGRRLMIYCAELASDGTTPPAVGAMSKVFSGELMERYGEIVLDLLGQRAAISQGAEGAIVDGKFEQQLRHSLMWVISIGTNEIQRNLIAQRGLGLPR